MRTTPNPCRPTRALSAALLGLAASTASLAQEGVVAGGNDWLGGYTALVPELSEPSGVALGEDGVLYVLEAMGDRVRTFEVGGAQLGVFPELPGEVGPLLDPRGLAVQPGGRVWVADSGHDRLVVFDAEGAFVKTVGGPGHGPGQWNFPAGLTASAERVLVADARNHRVQVLDGQGKLLFAFGSRGYGEGQFNHPSDVAVDEEGNVYVADSLNHRVQKFDAEGAFLKVWGDFGPYPGFFATPTGVEFESGRLYVADRDNHRIQIFDPAGEQIYEWGLHALRPREGDGRLHYPDQIAVAPGGAFAVVAESFENRCQVFGIVAPGTPLTELVAPLERSTSAHFGPGLAVSGELMGLCEPSGPAVMVYDLVTGLTSLDPIQVTKLSVHGRRTGQFLRPEDVEIDLERRVLYAADAALGRLSSFHMEWSPEKELGFDPGLLRLERSLDLVKLATARGEPAIEPAGVELGPDGRLWVIDATAHRLVVFTPELSFVGPFDARFARPTDLAFGEERMYVVDQLEQRVRMFDLRGRPQGSFGGPGTADGRFSRPFGICVGADGSVFVTDSALDRVQRFDAAGEHLDTFGARGIYRSQFYRPMGIQQDPLGRLIVLDHGNHRIQLVEPDGTFVHAFGARLFTRPTRTVR